MRSIRHKLFKKCFEELSPQMQESARISFEKWKKDPKMVDWHFLTGTKAQFYAADVGYSARAVALLTKDKNNEVVCVWVFIGTHEKYNNFINIQRQRKQESYLKNLGGLNTANPPEPQKTEQPHFKQEGLDIKSWRESKNKKKTSPSKKLTY